MRSPRADRLPPKTVARIAGFLYLCMAMFGLFAMTVNAGIARPGDPTATVMAIRNAGPQLRLGLAADVISSLAFLLTAMALYDLLKHVHAVLAAAMVTFVAVGVAVGFANLLNQYAQLAIATDRQYDAVLGPGGVAPLVTLFASLQGFGTALDEIFWGLWLLPLGYLALKSDYFPTLIGALLLIAGVSWMVQSALLLGGVDLGGVASLLTAGSIGEFVFIGYLLVKGARTSAAAGQPYNIEHQLEPGL